MKITLYRSSGSPINLEDKKLYFEELNLKTDEIEKTLGKCNADNVNEFAKILEQVHRDLSKSYPNKKRIQCPDSPKALESLCKEYEGAIAFCMEEDKLVAYIMDA